MVRDRPVVLSSEYAVLMHSLLPGHPEISLRYGVSPSSIINTIEILSFQTILAMPDVHSGYGFCIGNVAAFDMDDPEAVASPGKFKTWFFSET